MASEYNQLDLLSIRNDTFLREVAYHDQVESTNSVATELAKTDCETPLLVIASKQTAGRGRGDNQWWSSEGALTFTLLLDLPVLDPGQIGPFSLTAGLAVCQSLEKLAPGADLALKWPNDVFLNAKKVCGILIERPIAAEPRLVVGIGVNVNNSTSEAPPEIAELATSLRDQTGEDFTLTTVLIEILQQVESRVHDHVHRRAMLFDQYRAYCMLTGCDIVVDAHGNKVSGVCGGIDDDGALIINDGVTQQKVVAGVVTVHD